MSVTGLGRIAMADKMSVDQLKEALQNKTLPAYIAIPLIEEKMDMEEHMMRYRAMREMGQQQPPIADAILARTAQPAGVDALPTNLPMAGMAGGGIVAFADGGMSDDDDDEEEDDSFDEAVDKENAELLRKLMAIRAMGAGQGIADLPVSSGAMGIDALGSGLRPTTAVGETEAPRTSLAAARTDSGMGLKAPKGHKYADQITAKAEQMGLDPQFALYIAGKETGGLRNPETAKSSAGALGVMQLMPGTAKDMGVKDPLDPEQNIAGGLRYAKMMMDKYGDPKLAAIAYNWGPGNTDKWLKAGADPMKLPKETRNYVASLKEGGAIRFQNEGLVSDPIFSGVYTGQPTAEEILAAMEEERLRKAPQFGVLAPVPGAEPKGLPITDPRIQEKLRKTPEGMSPEAREEYFRNLKSRAEGAPFGTPSPAQAQAQAAAQEAAAAAAGETKQGGTNLQDRLEALLSKRESGLAAQREQDKYMALLTAGLGMMGGTSRNALQNISQGALQGVGYAQSAAKQRAAEENAILSGRLGQYKVGQTESLRRELAASGKEAKLGQQLTAMENKILDAARNDVIKTGIAIDSAAGQAAISKRIAELRAANPYLAKLYKELGLPELQTAPMAKKPRTADELIAERKRLGY